MDQEKQRENDENNMDNPLSISPNGRVISYNVPEWDRPGGIKVRFKIRIATGKRAQLIAHFRVSLEGAAAPQYGRVHPVTVGHPQGCAPHDAGPGGAPHG